MSIDVLLYLALVSYIGSGLVVVCSPSVKHGFGGHYTLFSDLDA